MPPPPLLKFLATPLPSLVADEENLVIGFGPPHFRNASAIAARVPCTKDSDSTPVLNENYGLGLESSTRTRTQVQVG